MSHQHRKYFISGIIICVFGAICFSTKAIFVKLAYRDTEVDAVALLALRMIFSLPFFVISAIASSRKTNNVKFTTKQWLCVAIVGCLGYYVSSLLDFLGLQYVTAGIERLILFIYPTLVLLFSTMVFGGRIKRIQWRLIPTVGAAKFNSYAMSCACVAVLIHYFVTTDQSLFNLTWPVYIYSISMALIGTVVPSYLVTEGIKRIGSDNAAIVGSVGPVSTIIQAYFFLGEPISMLQIIGTIFVLVGVLLIGKN